MKRFALLLFALALMGCHTNPDIIADPSNKADIQYYVDRAVRIYTKVHPDVRGLLDRASVEIHTVDPDKIHEHCGLPKGFALACTQQLEDDPQTYRIFVPRNQINLTTHEMLHVLMWQNGVRVDRHHAYMIEMRMF